MRRQDMVEAKIALMKPVFNKEMENAAINSLWNEHFVLGESVYKFEEEFAKYCGVDYAVSTSSGTNALQIALKALGVKENQYVITSSASFVASSNVILHVGAEPIFSDIDLKTYTLDPEQIKHAIRKGTKAIIPVHLYGYPSDMDSINETAEKRGLHVVEDACQAHGAKYKGRKVGTLGEVACFSFFPSKNMTVAGDGGIMVTNNKMLALKASKLRNCGRKSQYIHDSIGYTSRLNTVNASIGRVQLKHLDEWNAKRRRNAENYNRLLSDIDELILPPKDDGETRPVYHLYVIRTKNRHDLKAMLESNGIECGIHYALPIHLQPIYRKMYGFKEGMYPRSEELCRTCLSIPMHPGLTPRQVNYVSEKTHEFFASR